MGTINTTTNERFFVDYRITLNDGQDIKKIAQEICIEQTVEIPEDCVPQTHWDYGITGIVEDIIPSDKIKNQVLVSISYHCDISSYSVPQLLNTLFGNISLKNNIRIDNLRVPQSFSQLLPGPRWGIDGIREKLDVFNRPLTCTALKPVGLSSTELASMASQFATGGADIIKDDHGITNQPFAKFEDRVQRVQAAINEANAKSGTKTIYCPMLNDEPDLMKKQVDFCLKSGIEGALAAPMLIGCGAFVSLRRQTDLILMAHPAFAGTFFHSNLHGATPAFLLGRFFRLIGADISIFPNAGGRFSFTQEECNELSDALRMPDNNILPAFPAPAGGMRIERVSEMYEKYGKDTVFIIGGNLQQLSEDLSVATGLFLEAVRNCACATKEIL
jgi:ribulose-bisphosphate carboxylase large chain